MRRRRRSRAGESGLSEINIAPLMDVLLVLLVLFLVCASSPPRSVRASFPPGGQGAESSSLVLQVSRDGVYRLLRDSHPLGQGSLEQLLPQLRGKSVTVQPDPDAAYESVVQAVAELGRRQVPFRLRLPSLP